MQYLSFSGNSRIFCIDGKLWIFRIESILWKFTFPRLIFISIVDKKTMRYLYNVGSDKETCFSFYSSPQKRQKRVLFAICFENCLLESYTTTILRLYFLKWVIIFVSNYLLFSFSHWHIGEKFSKILIRKYYV